MKKLAIILAVLGSMLFITGILLGQMEPGGGINSQITDVTIGEDTVPVVTFTLTDGNGNPLSLEDIESVRFLVARIDEDEETAAPIYINYFHNEVEGTEYEFQGQIMQPALETVNQPTFESGEGTFAEIEPGVYTYTFAQPLGDDYDDRRIQVVAAEVIRGPRNVAANPVYTLGDSRINNVVVQTESCNDCHGELEAHGGSRKEVGLCVTCHTPENIDPETGNSLDFKVLIHRIHSGVNLPSVQDGDPYYIVGHNESIHDYSTVAWPQDTRNCATCHTGTEEVEDDFGEWPTKAACTSCHDNVDPTIALNHTGSPKQPDSCYRCHFPELEEFDEESIPGAHLIPRYSSQVAGVNLEILGVENAAPGQSPTITFRVTTNDGETIAPAEMDYLAVTVAGPTSDYVNRVTEVIYRSSAEGEPQVTEGNDGAFSYTLAFTFPEEATGSYAFGLEGYVMEELEDVADPVRIAGFNPVTYVSLAGGEPDPRRQVVDLENCDNCHKDLALHGTIRQNTEYCVLCHNPSATDEERRPEDALPPVSISFSRMIHQIHNGENANQPLQVYGFGESLHDFGEVRFPGNIENCMTCHLSDTYNVLPEERAPVTITQGDQTISQIQPARAVCTSCHDTAASDGHAELQTTASGVETCAVCHGPDREFALSDIHP